MNAELLSAEANARLGELYRPKLEAWRKLKETTKGLSIPMFLQATPEWFAAKPRIMFVGQETHGWCTECKLPPAEITVPYVMNFYHCEGMTKYRVTARSFFWRAIRKISSELGIQGFPQSVLSANLFPCDTNRRRSPEELLIKMREWRTLPDELRILSPEMVIFFVGPGYAWNLGRYFGTEVEPRLTRENLLQPYHSKDQPWKAWVTYHPASLNRFKRWDVIGQLTDLIRSAR